MIYNHADCQKVTHISWGFSKGSGCIQDKHSLSQFCVLLLKINRLRCTARYCDFRCLSSSCMTFSYTRKVMADCGMTLSTFGTSPL